MMALVFILKFMGNLTIGYKLYHDVERNPFL